ncbi:glycosyltransferase family A protein [Hoyosella subflava]|uniref:Glycosyl transferase n=1 Tax=Hoyosella subflava (strain DSM 45089 / JCM 17490 / NBRC 109087 / DQS3-9A1) TaxID=443218 RepID=F6EGC6_HOYSD|nr:glycosyltransferase family A protein [Hoyosella subflava]AEF39851.1 Glycosyl transferase [Hoyosella subflava DQS3-9A1]
MSANDRIERETRGNTTVVVATRNRAPELARALSHLAQLEPVCPVIVVDNASNDDTPAVVEQCQRDFPENLLTYIRLRKNRGAVARNYGIWRARTSFVAFCDDDSWWEPDALRRAETIFADHPRVGLIAGRVLVGGNEDEDPTNRLMANSPRTGSADSPGPEIIGFLACACVARAVALRKCGGFNAVLDFVGEERMLAYELAADGWTQCYVDAIVAHHYPSQDRPGPQHRQAVVERNEPIPAIVAVPATEARRALTRLARAVLKSHYLAPALWDSVKRLPLVKQVSKQSQRRAPVRPPRLP